MIGARAVFGNKTSARASQTVFGLSVTLIGCYKGITCGLGADGVGRATTEAVVYASITILITNFFLTLVLEQLCVILGI